MTVCLHMIFNFKQRFNKLVHFYISHILETLDNHIYMEEVKSGLSRTIGKRAHCLLPHTDCEKCSSERVWI